MNRLYWIGRAPWCRGGWQVDWAAPFSAEFAVQPENLILQFLQSEHFILQLLQIVDMSELILTRIILTTRKNAFDKYGKPSHSPFPRLLPSIEAAPIWTLEYKYKIKYKYKFKYKGKSKQNKYAPQKLFTSVHFFHPFFNMGVLAHHYSTNKIKWMNMQWPPVFVNI